MRVTFYDENFTEIDIGIFDVKTLDLVVSSPTPEHQRQDISGQNGVVTLGSTLGSRTLTVDFFIAAVDKYDFYLVRNEVFKVFNGLKFLYIVDEREPGKRWKVKLDTNYTMERLTAVHAKFEMTFTSDSPFAESIGTTQTPLTFDAEVWQIGQGLLAEDLSYTQTTDSFQIYNAGDVIIDPRFIHTPLTIELTTKYTYNGSVLSLTNTTTGDTWTFTGDTTAGQIIQLKNVECLKGGASVALKTNFGLMRLQPGYNNFTKSSNISQVKFIHRFYYK